jgi:hypothetical protein
MQDDDTKVRAPHTQLPLPVPDGCDWCHYNAGLVELAVGEAGQKCSELHRLTKAHFVPHDACTMIKNAIAVRGLLLTGWLVVRLYRWLRIQNCALLDRSK